MFLKAASVLSASFGATSKATKRSLWDQDVATDYPPVLAIVGSRNYPDTLSVRQYVSTLPTGTVVVSGGKGNVDITVRHVAAERWFEFLEFVPEANSEDWRVLEIRRWGPLHLRNHTFKTRPKRYPHFAAAAHARNDMIIRYCVENEGGVTVFIDRSQRTPGSESMVAKAAKAGVLFEVRELTHQTSL